VVSATTISQYSGTPFAAGTSVAEVTETFPTNRPLRKAVLQFGKAAAAGDAIIRLPANMPATKQNDRRSFHPQILSRLMTFPPLSDQYSDRVIHR
jgi:hypothetical protein